MSRLDVIAVVVSKGSCPADTLTCIVVADMSLYDLNELSIEVLDAQGKVIYSQT